MHVHITRLLALTLEMFPSIVDEIEVEDDGWDDDEQDDAADDQLEAWMTFEQARSYIYYIVALMWLSMRSSMFFVR